LTTVDNQSEISSGSAPCIEWLQNEVIRKLLSQSSVIFSHGMQDVSFGTRVPYLTASLS